MLRGRRWGLLASEISLAALCLFAAGCAGGGTASTPVAKNADTTTASGGERVIAVKTPTPTPTPGPEYVVVTVNQPTVYVNPGATTTVACALTVASGSNVGTGYKVVDWGDGTHAGGGATFPVENYPLVSNIAWNLPTLNATYTPLADDGAPGQTVYTSIPVAPKQYCVNLALTVPAAQAAGAYPATIDFALYVSASANGSGLLHLAATTTATFNVEVL